MTTKTIKVPMDVHNTFRECDYELRDHERNANAKVHPFMAPLIAELSRKQPTWTFVTPIERNYRERSADGLVYFYARFAVCVDDEEIGWIDYETNWRDSSKSYEFNSRQLNRKRSRGNSTKTKDLKKAAKIITASFSEMSHSEHIYAAASAVRTTTAQLKSRRHYHYNGLESGSRAEVTQFLRANWANFLASVPAGRREELSTLLEKYDELDGTINISAKMSKHGAFVKLLGDKYIVQDAGGDDVHVFKNDTLPNALRGSIGALKLVNVDTLIPDIGVRSADNSFFVLPMETHDE